jgi:hypothetical protein
MGCQTCYIGSVNANASGILIEKFTHEDATKSDEGALLDKAGVANELYNDAAFSITWAFTGSATTQAASLNALSRALLPGASMVWKETGMSSSMTTTIRTVSAGATEYHVGFARATFTGTREPFWEGATVTASASAQPDWIGTGTVNYDGSAVTIGGEVSARPTVRYTCSAALSLVGIAFTNASATPFFDMSGTANASSETGESASATGASGVYAIMSSGTLNLTGDAGRKLVYARTFGRTTTSWKARSRLLGESISASAVVDSDPASITTSGAFSVIAMGPITVPCVGGLTGMVPSFQMMYADSSADASQVTYLDHVTLFPLEHAIVVNTATAATQGVYIDDGVAYLADADGEASISQDGVTFYGSWGIPCGSHAHFVVVSAPTADSAPPTAGTLDISYTERFVHRA